MLKMINLQGIDVEYIEQGQDSSTTFLFLHGNSSNISIFSQYMQNLSNRYKCFGMNYLGHGKTEIIDENIISVAHYKEMVVNFIEHFNMQNIVIIGHSLGGHVALELLACVAERIKHVVTISAPPFNLVTIEKTFKDPTSGAIFKEELSQDEIDIIAKSFIDSTLVEMDEYRSVVDAIANTDGRFRSILGLSLANGFLTDEIKIVKESTPPITFVFNRDDPFISVNVYEELKDIRSRIELLPFTGGKHMPFLENYDGVYSYIEGFCAN